jgi:hypothetical protein
MKAIRDLLMIKYIYLAWQDQNTRRWHVIGRLSRTEESYEFRYTKGVQNIQNFVHLPTMSDHKKTYHSTELFSLFKNRIMPKSRPDYSNYISWMGLNTENVDELASLAISGGEKETDFFRIIPNPEKNDTDKYSFKFFVHGLSHMLDEAKQRAQSLSNGDTLYLMPDPQNNKDCLALALRSDDPPCLIGYIPAYLTKVIQVNKEAPMQMFILCELSSTFLDQPWEKYEEEFKLIEQDI